jgi:PBP1b-binding outer membrane lipoprotein LpoB
MTNRYTQGPTHIRSMIAVCGMILVSALLLSGCIAEEPQTEDAPAPAEVDAGTDTMPGMSDMPGMQDGMMGGMMGQMMGHMQMMRGAGADSMQAMLPMHRQMVANMLAQMNREMREMNMTTDARWDATVDSLRNDLTRMPEMSGSELQTMMPAHHDRMMRLMEMHRTMMSDMEM